MEMPSHGSCAEKVACNNATFAANPTKGGKPASDSSAVVSASPSHGALAPTPFNPSIVVTPKRRSIASTDANAKPFIAAYAATYRRSASSADVERDETASADAMKPA